MSLLADTHICWRPSPDAVTTTNLAHFVAALKLPFAPADYRALHRWSIEAPERFWKGVADFAGVQFSNPADTVLQNPERMPGARWFPGARLNFAEHLLRSPDDRAAIVWADEAGARGALTRRELCQAAADLAAGLRGAGVRAGDSVAAILPNGPHAVIAMLASASVGAVFSSCSPEFGDAAVIERFGQIEPVLLFGCADYSYNGRRFECLPSLEAVAAELPSLRCTVVSGDCGASLPAGCMA